MATPTWDTTTSTTTVYWDSYYHPTSKWNIKVYHQPQDARMPKKKEEPPKKHPADVF